MMFLYVSTCFLNFLGGWQCTDIIESFYNHPPLISTVRKEWVWTSCLSKALGAVKVISQSCMRMVVRCFIVFKCF